MTNPLTLQTLQLQSPCDHATVILLSHGSRDPRPPAAIARLAQQLEAQWLQIQWPQTGGWVRVVSAVLELGEVPLYEQLVAIARSGLAPAEFQRVYILPLFLLPGIHTQEDIPAEVARAEAAIASTPLTHPQRTPLTPTPLPPALASPALASPAQVFTLLPYLGSWDGIETLVQRQRIALALPTDPAIAYILLAHGSRRPGGHRPVDVLAQRLGITPAYWSQSPSLSQQISQLQAQGYQRIGILPYFLFAGGLMDAIAQHLDAIAQETALELAIAPCLGEGEGLGEWIAEQLSRPPGVKTAV